MGYIQGSRSWDCFGAPKMILPRISESSVQVSAKWMWAPAAVRRVMHWATFSTCQYNSEMHYWKGLFLQQQWLMICSMFFPTKDSSSYKDVSKRVRNQFQIYISDWNHIFPFETFWVSMMHVALYSMRQFDITNPKLTRARTCLLVLLVTALGGVWTLEQPSGSLLEFYPAWREVMCNIFRCGGEYAAMYLDQWCNASICFYSTENNDHYSKQGKSQCQIRVILDWNQYTIFPWALGFK